MERVQLYYSIMTQFRNGTNIIRLGTFCFISKTLTLLFKKKGDSLFAHDSVFHSGFFLFNCVTFSSRGACLILFAMSLFVGRYISKWKKSFPNPPPVNMIFCTSLIVRAIFFGISHLWENKELSLYSVSIAFMQASNCYHILFGLLVVVESKYKQHFNSNYYERQIKSMVDFEHITNLFHLLLATFFSLLLILFVNFL